MGCHFYSARDTGCPAMYLLRSLANLCHSQKRYDASNTLSEAINLLEMEYCLQKFEPSQCLLNKFLEAGVIPEVSQYEELLRICQESIRKAKERAKTPKSAPIPEKTPELASPPAQEPPKA